ncbi:MAG: amidase family protein [Chloroflexota bacterium]
MTTRKLTSVELVTYYVDRIRRYDIGKLNAIMTLNPQALATAAVLDDERANGLMRGPLHGIPVLLKDNIATADMPTTAGVFALRNWQPDHDAFLTARLREAGAIVLGKTNLSEFANYTDPNTPNGFSTLGGQTQNPHGPFDPLGSSSDRPLPPPPILRPSLSAPRRKAPLSCLPLSTACSGLRPVGALSVETASFP